MGLPYVSGVSQTYAGFGPHKSCQKAQQKAHELWCPDFHFSEYGNPRFIECMLLANKTPENDMITK